MVRQQLIRLAKSLTKINKDYNSQKIKTEVEIIYDIIDELDEARGLLK